MMKRLADKQTTTRPSSHGEDGVSEGGWSGYPSDSQTTLEKLHVGLSDDRDRAAEVLESETSGPVSSRTRSKEKRAEVDRGASWSNDRSGDDDTGQDCNAGATHTMKQKVVWMSWINLFGHTVVNVRHRDGLSRSF